MKARNLREKFEETVSRFGNRTAIRYKKDDEWQDLSYRGMEDRIRAVSSFLRETGVRENDKIAVCMENRPEWPIIFFSSVFMGVIFVPLSPVSIEKDIENVLNDSECRLVFADKMSFALLDKIRERCPAVEKIIPVDSDVFRKLLEVPSARTEYGQIENGQTACLLYTSGTTAEPKGVMLTHGNLFANWNSMYALGLVSYRDSMVQILPLHHVYPMMVMLLMPLLCGAKIIYPGTIRGETVLEVVREQGVTIFVAVPQVYYAFYQKISEALEKIPFPVSLLLRFSISLLYWFRRKTGINLSRYFLYGIHKKFGRAMRFFVSGGAKFDKNIEEALFRLGFTVLEGYGLTETSPVLTFNPVRKPKIGSAGKAVPGVEMKILGKNEHGAGEVAVRGANIMKGYYKKPEETNRVMKDGWFCTGDAGYIDKDGYLFLTGRLKEMIVLSSGLNVYPEEIEKVYSASAPIKEMCVFALPFKKRTEGVLALWAVVVPDIDFFKKYGDVNLKILFKERFDNVSRTLPPYKRLMGFSITLEALPRTLLGKVKRFEVEEIYMSKALDDECRTEQEELSEEDIRLMEERVGRKIIAYLEKQSTIKKTVVPGDLLELDLGIDSLGRIELAAGLEKLFDIEMKDSVIGEAFTVRDLITGIKPLLPEENGVLRMDEEEMEEMTFGPGRWKEILQVPPGKENMEKIDLSPGWGAWLGGFMLSGFIKIICSVFFSLKVEGQENLPAKGPYMIYANHTSFLDAFVVLASMPDLPKLDLFFIGYRFFFNVPIVRNLIKLGRIIPLDFSSHFLEALRSCFYVLDNGKVLCLFPEGLRSFDGHLRDFKKGFGILAKETNAKLLPVLIKGAFEAWPRTSKFPKRHPVKVVIGKALDPVELERHGLEKGAEDGYKAICILAREALREQS